MDEEYSYAPDISYVHVESDVLYPDGCDFNRAAIVCPPKKRYDGQCEKCGWNPRVARRRSYLIRKEIEEENGRDD